MCEICGHFPCHPRCPNADVEPPLFTCEKCSEDIYENDSYYHIDDMNLCEYCFVEYAKEKYECKAEPEEYDFDEY